MSQNNVVVLDNVSLSYKTESGRKTLKSALTDRKKSSSTDSSRHFQLQNINLQIKHGEQIGIIGRNGSGKSTLLKLVAGVLRPDIGKVSIDGEITPLIDIGTGMHPDLTCKDNIFLSGAYLGFSRKQMQSHFDFIVNWAEIQSNLDELFHTLSTGTQSRLAFAVATCQTPDIILVDEIMSVGDIAFQRKSKIRMEELKNSGSAVLIVSHDLDYLQNYVSRVIWIKDGEIVADGPTKEIIDSYKASF